MTLYAHRHLAKYLKAATSCITYALNKMVDLVSGTLCCVFIYGLFSDPLSILANDRIINGLAVPGHALLWLSLVKWKRKKRESARL
jgi:hypothetical protein